MVKFRTFIDHKLATNAFIASYGVYLTMYVFVKEANGKLPIWNDQASEFSAFIDKAIS
jgi:hypothetical protein